MKTFKKHIDEAVEIRHDRYMRSHGKKAKGGEGTWMFTHKNMGDVDYNDDKQVHTARGKFSDAAKSAKAWAKKHGHSAAYVMEEVELEEAYKATSQKSQFGGHRSHLKNPEGKTSYMGSASYKKPEHAKGEAQAYHDAYFGGPGKANERGAERAVAAYRAKHKEHMHEEVELDEAVKVDKKDYSWGRMVTVRHGNSHTFPLHPQHQEKIKKLSDGGKVSFKDETGTNITATRQGDKVHLKHPNVNKKTTVDYKHFAESVELDEVLDTPKAMDSYKNKAKASKEKAANSATAKILRGKNADGSRADHSPELKTMAKREKGLKMADKNAMKKTFKALRGEEVELEESEVNNLTAQYINENNITVDQLENMTEEELNELIGKAIGGAFKLGAKAAVGATRLAGKAVKRASTAGRADAAEKKADSLEKKNKDRERIKAAQDRLRKAKEASRNK